MQHLPTKKGYDPTLDGLRALSALLVLAFHSSVPWLQNGRVGVSVFFVLSGYLITQMLMGGISARDFYERRARRLVPGYLFFLFVVLMTAPVVFPAWNVLRSFLWSLFYLSDYAVPYFGMRGPLTHTWSLAIEMQFYLLWPFVVRHGSARWLIVLFLCALALRFGFYLATEDWQATYMTLHGNSAGLVLGSILAVYKDRLKPNALVGWVGAILVLGSAIAATNETSVSTLVMITTTEIGTVAIMMGAGRLHRLLSAEPLVWLGKRSYGFYLWHLPIVAAVRPYADWPAKFMIAAVCSAAIAAISYTYVEQPFRRRRTSLPKPAIA